jgi:hypothetical protein
MHVIIICQMYRDEFVGLWPDGAGRIAPSLDLATR